MGDDGRAGGGGGRRKGGRGTKGSWHNKSPCGSWRRCQGCRIRLRNDRGLPADRPKFFPRPRHVANQLPLVPSLIDSRLPSPGMSLATFSLQLVKVVTLQGGLGAISSRAIREGTPQDSSFGTSSIGGLKAECDLRRSYRLRGRSLQSLPFLMSYVLIQACGRLSEVCWPNLGRKHTTPRTCTLASLTVN